MATDDKDRPAFLKGVDTSENSEEERSFDQGVPRFTKEDKATLQDFSEGPTIHGGNGKPLRFPDASRLASMKQAADSLGDSGACLTVTLDPKMMWYINQLIESGAHGKTKEEVVRRLVWDAIIHHTTTGWI